MNRGTDLNFDYEAHQKGNQLSQLNPRVGFIRKVYVILTTQILITTLFTALTLIFEDVIGKFLLENIWLVFLCAIATIVIMVILVCFRNTARKVPTNYILLFTFTFCESIIVAFMCMQYSKLIVLCAACLTTALFLALTVYACTTKKDFTMMGGTLFVLCFVLFFAGILVALTGIKILYMAYLVFGIILFSIYVIYDTQLIMQNKQHSLDIDDYIIGALMLYVDFIQLFLYILQLLGSQNN